MDRSGGPDGCRECAAQVEQVQGRFQGEDGKGRCVTDPIDAASGLEYLRRAGVHVRRAVEDGALLLGWVAVDVWKVMVPTCCCGSETAKLIPA